MTCGGRLPSRARPARAVRGRLGVRPLPRAGRRLAQRAALGFDGGEPHHPRLGETEIADREAADDALLPLAGAPSAAAEPTELLLSEYVEGSSNNKAIELFYGTGAPVEAIALAGRWDMREGVPGMEKSTVLSNSILRTMCL